MLLCAGILLSLCTSPELSNIRYIHILPYDKNITCSID